MSAAAFALGLAMALLTGPPTDLLEQTRSDISQLGQRRFPGPCLETIDHGADGLVDSRIVYEYDAQGRSVAELHYLDGGGQPYSRVSNTYDAAGELVESTRDVRVDGTVDARTRFEYDGDGNRTAESYDAGGDGRFDSVTHFEYDDGRLERARRRTGPDGRIEIDYAYTYQVDADGNALVTDIDSLDDGSIDVRYVATYDADGNRLTLARDDDADGHVERFSSFTYDAAGNRLAVEVDEDGDGRAERRLLYNYACWF